MYAMDNFQAFIESVGSEFEPRRGKQMWRSLDSYTPDMVVCELIQEQVRFLVQI
jgi:hypothetical protein